MKFTDPVTRLFFFIELVKAVSKERANEHTTHSVLIALAGELNPACLAEKPTDLRDQAIDFYNHCVLNTAQPHWLETGE